MEHGVLVPLGTIVTGTSASQANPSAQNSAPEPRRVGLGDFELESGILFARHHKRGGRSNA